MAQHNETGEWGEKVALEALAAKGYAIVDQNWRMGHYELDIIAMDGQSMVFVEVKTRTNDEYDPLEAVDRAKQRRICSSADVYMRHYDAHHEYRFDIITIIGTPGNYALQHIEDAFLPPLRRH